MAVYSILVIIMTTVIINTTSIHVAEEGMSPNVESSYADTDAHQLKATTQIHKYTNTESS